MRQSTEYNFYTKAHFDVQGFYNSLTSDNPSTLARLASLMTNAVQSIFGSKLLPLPKLVVIVLDSDIINMLGDTNQSISKAFSKMINFIMTEYEHCVATFKENLPAKCIRNVGFPHFLWIQPPKHKNFSNNSQHYKFNRCLEENVKLHPHTYTLALKKGWDDIDDNLFSKDTQRFSVAGYRAYWEAVDKTILYLDSVILKKNDNRKNQKRNNLDISQKDRFRWQNPNLNLHSVLLPPLPRHPTM